MPLSTLILAALGLGIVVGYILNSYFPSQIPGIEKYFLQPAGDSFLRLIQFLVVPLVFSSLIVGFSKVQNASQLARYTVKLLVSYALTTAIALFIGIVTALVLQPGKGITGLQLPQPQTIASSHPSIIQWLLQIIPTNPLAALTEGNLLQVIFSAAVFAIAIPLAGEKSRPFVDLMDSLYSLSEKALFVILYYAPVGVFALIASVIATQGIDILFQLLLYVFGLLLASLVMVGVYILILLLVGEKPLKLFHAMTQSLILAFSTASSNAVLPVLMDNIQNKYGIAQEIASFALPLGTALKRDGSAILQGFNALFIAQIYHIPITFPLITSIAISSFFVSFSTPGVPGSALITMTTVLSAAGLPVEGIAIVAGVDRLTDGFKTVINVIGNAVNALLLSRWETQKYPPAGE